MISDLSPDDVQAELAALYAKRPQVIKPGLERIRSALSHLPGLGSHAPIVIVGGTNGKGTTAGFLAQLHAAAGRKTGLFTSPHLEHFSERFWVSGATISDLDLVMALERLRARLPTALYEELSFFEVNTLLAMQVFAEAGTDITILEVGLGGRWDSTNVFDPVLSVITSIGMDHQEFLGDTIALIAAEKAGIMRANRVCLWAGCGQPDADAVMAAEASARGAILQRAGSEFGLAGDGTFFATAGGERVKADLPSEFNALPTYLRANFITALAAFYHWERAVDPAVVSLVLTGGLERPPSLRGRFEFLQLARRIGPFNMLLLDACHNPHGAAAFVAALSEFQQRQNMSAPLPAVVSILKDKDHGAILDELRQACGPVVLFSNRSERSWLRDDVAARHRDLPFCDDFSTAVHLVGERSIEQPLVVCGSVHLIGEVLAALRPYQT